MVQPAEFFGKIRLRGLGTPYRLVPSQKSTAQSSATYIPTCEDRCSKAGPGFLAVNPQSLSLSIRRKTYFISGTLCAAKTMR